MKDDGSGTSNEPGVRDAVRERLEVPRVEERPGGEVVDWVGVDDCIGVVDDVGRNGAGLGEGVEEREEEREEERGGGRDEGERGGQQEEEEGGLGARRGTDADHQVLQARGVGWAKSLAGKGV